MHVYMSMLMNKEERGNVACTGSLSRSVALASPRVGGEEVPDLQLHNSAAFNLDIRK